MFDIYSFVGSLWVNKGPSYPVLITTAVVSLKDASDKVSFSEKEPNVNLSLERLTDIREIKDLFRKNLSGSLKIVNENTIFVDRNSLFIYNDINDGIFSNVEAGKEFNGVNFTFFWDFNNKPKNFTNDKEVEYIDASKINNNLEFFLFFIFMEFMNMKKNLYYLIFIDFC